MSSNNIHPALNEAKTAARLIADLVADGYHCEAILLRLVIGGIVLKDAVAFTVGDAHDLYTSALENRQSLQLGSEFDPYCCLAGINSLPNVLFEFIRRWIGDGCSEFDRNQPLFPSRKGGAPISGRSAERLLKQALRVVGKHRAFTFRRAAVLGRKLRKCRKDSAAAMPIVDCALGQVRRLLTRRFVNDPDGYDDAEQTIVLALLENNVNGCLTESDAFVIAVSTFREFCRKQRNRAKNEVSGILGDWSTVTNRIDARVRTAEEHESSVNILSERDMRARLYKLLGRLREREREIIKLRFGLQNDRSYIRSRKQIAARFGITPERVRQIEQRTIRKLQQPPQAGELVGFLD